MKVFLTPEAEADLQATLELIRVQSPSAAVKLANGVFSALEMLTREQVDGPRHELGTGEAFRSWLIPPYRVYYRQRENALHVLRIDHHARPRLAT